MMNFYAVSSMLVASAVILLCCLIPFSTFSRQEKFICLVTCLIVMISIILPVKYLRTEFKEVASVHPQKIENAFFQALALIERDAYAVYLSKIKENLQNKGDQNAQLIYAEEFANTIFIKYAHNATDDSLYHFLKTEISFQQYLLETDPYLLVQKDFPTKFSQKEVNKCLLKKQNEPFFRANHKAKEAVILSSVLQTVPSLTEKNQEEAKTLLAEVMQTLDKKYGIEMVSIAFQHPELIPVDKKIVASVILDFNKEVYSLGEKRAGLVLRAISTYSY